MPREWVISLWHSSSGHSGSLSRFHGFLAQDTVFLEPEAARRFVKGYFLFDQIDLIRN